jgi:hypothetical protein
MKRTSSVCWSSALNISENDQSCSTGGRTTKHSEGALLCLLQRSSLGIIGARIGSWFDVEDGELKRGSEIRSKRQNGLGEHRT